MANLLGTVMVIVAGRTVPHVVAYAGERCPIERHYCADHDRGTCAHFCGIDTVDHEVVVHCDAAQEDNLER